MLGNQRLLAVATAIFPGGRLSILGEGRRNKPHGFPSAMKDAVRMSDSARHERFMQLFLPAERGLRAYLRTLVPNRDDAEDVLQAAATVLWDKFDDYQPGTRFDCWAYQVVRFQALSHFKTKRRSRLVFNDEVLAIVADHAAAMAAKTEETMESLGICLEKLTERDREVLRMRFQPGATNRSVAETLGRSERTVGRLLNQLYGNLLECIQHRSACEQQGDQR